MAELEAGTTGAARPRPLSPHLQIYKPMLTMMMSIVHRITGAALYFGMLLLAWWLIAAATGPNAYANVEWFMGSLIGQMVLLRLHMGVAPSHARRHASSDLGHNSRLRAGRARNADARDVWSDRSHSRSLSGWSAISSWEARDERRPADAYANAARSRPGRGSFRHRQFLASTRDVGRRHSADHRPAPHHHCHCSDEATQQSSRFSARRLSRSSCCCSSSTPPITCGSACRKSSSITCMTKNGSC